MHKITVSSKSEYDVLIGHDVLNKHLDDSLDYYKNVIFFIDENTGLEIDGAIYINPQEQQKNLETYNELLQVLLMLGVPRIDTCFCAIGGGIVLDIVGFLASTYKRGVDVFYVPTTLLSMVDVAIGSKNGVNVLNLKNQVGTFYDPKKVFIDTQFLNSLEQRELNNGMAEVIKAGCLFDLSLFDDLNQDELDFEQIIYKSLLVKKHFIEADMEDHGIRKNLNFGHTYGHAIEAYYDFEKYKHGEAVSIGMNMMFDDIRLKSICEKFNLPTSFEEDVKVLDKFLVNDKKSTGKINFVTINQLGDYRV